MTYLELMQNLQMYDKMVEIDSSIQEMVRKKKEEEILQYIHTIHSRSVSQMSTGRYAGCWQTRLGNGKNDSKYIRTKTLTELLNAVTDYYNIVQPKDETIGTYFPHWLDWKFSRNNNKAGTKRHNQNCYNRFVKDSVLESIPIKEITTEDLDNWARDVLKNTPLSSKRFNTLKITVTGPLDLAVREHIIDVSPWKPELMDYQMLLKAERKAPSNQKLFYEDEIKAIVKKCMSDYEVGHNSSNIAVIFNFDMGLRVGELAALKWSDVDWKRKVINIQRQESEGKTEEYVKSDSSAGYRELPLNDRLIRLLKRLQRDSGNLSGYIFTDAQGQRKTVSAIQKRLIYAQVGKGGDGAGSTVKRIHCQRRTVATKIAKARGLEAARQWLGHADLQTTLRYIYTTETIDTLREFSEEGSALKALETRPTDVVLVADSN